MLIDASGVAKLADFGTSKEQDAEGTRLDMSQTVCGTPYFWAPELMRNAGYGRKVDVWSVGGLGLQMATGDPPWKGVAKSLPALLMHVATAADGPPLDAYSSSGQARGS